MSFTVSNIASMEAHLKLAAGALLAPQDVDLYGAGSVVVKLHVGTRRASSDGLTPGADTETIIGTIDADDWDTKAGRPPQKGDVIWWTGVRYAIERPHVAAPGGNKAFYKVRLKG